MARSLRKVKSLGVTEEAYIEALKTAKTRPEDGATIELGRRIARFIDEECNGESETPNFLKLSAEFRAVLHSLKMTPISRSASAAKAEPAVAQTEKTSIQQMRDELAEMRARKASS